MSNLGERVFNDKGGYGVIKTYLWGWIRESDKEWIETAMDSEPWSRRDVCFCNEALCRERIVTSTDKIGVRTRILEKKVLEIPRWWSAFEEMRKARDQKINYSQMHFKGIMESAQELF